MNHLSVRGVVRTLALIIPLAAPVIALCQSEFHFRTPNASDFRVDASEKRNSATASPQWVRAWPKLGSTNYVEFGSRVVLQVSSGADLKRLIENSSLEVSRSITSNTFILQAPNAQIAMREAHRLAELPEVLASYPVMKRQHRPDGPYAPRSNDPFFLPYFNQSPKLDAQWPMENREYDGPQAGVRLGLDLNILAAWPYSKGEGITVAVADTGLELNHPDLTNRMAGAPHFDFGSQTNIAGPLGGGLFDPDREVWTHGTSVAGLIAAEGDNARGPVGVAPLAKLASWLIYETNTVVEEVYYESNYFFITNLVVEIVSDEALMQMYEFGSNIVDVQNHSWGSGAGKVQAGPALLERIGIENAVTLGRNGRGVVMVRASGNNRGDVARADDDGYTADPEVIVTAAVTRNGRATSYSEAGACVLVAAPGGGGDTVQGLFALDLLGSERGANAGIIYPPPLSDYRWGVMGFSGTSAAAPLVSGITALILSVNPNLGYRDVQHIIALSARHYDLTDPDLVWNGAGLRVSHNVGFGVPDAAHAVRLAAIWTNRPSLTTLTVTDSSASPIPDEGLRVEVTGVGVPSDLGSLQCFPTLAPHPDDPTPALPFVDIGTATGVPAINLTNKAALILRDPTPLSTKIANAAQAGAAFAVIYNSTNDSSLDFGLVLDTEYSPIPAVLIGNSRGEALKSLFATNASAVGRLRLTGVNRTFHINSTLLCERVGVRVRTDNPSRGDLRITLLSPQGTRSVLQRLNDDLSPGPGDWTYWSTHHLLESSAGDWTVTISDEAAGVSGSVLSVSLIIRGTQITDSDHDGLDDAWEISHFGNLSSDPADDPELDGFANSREQVMGTDPNVVNVPFELDLSRWNVNQTRLARLSWPSSTNFHYQVWGGSGLTTLSLITNLPGQFPETDFMSSITNTPGQFFQVLEVIREQQRGSKSDSSTELFVNYVNHNGNDCGDHQTDAD